MFVRCSVNKDKIVLHVVADIFDNKSYLLVLKYEYSNSSIKDIFEKIDKLDKNYLLDSDVIIYINKN